MSERLYNQPIPSDPAKWKRSMAAIIGRLGRQGILEASDIDSNGNFIAEKLSQKEYFKNEANQALLHNLENYQLKTGKLLNQAKRTQSIGPINPAEIVATPVLRVMVGGEEYARVINERRLAPPSQPQTQTPPRPVPIDDLRFTRQSLRPIGLEQDPKPKQNNTQKLNPPSFLERLKKPAKYALAGLAASVAMALGIGKALPAFTAPLESAPFANPTPEQPSPGEIPLLSKDAFFQALNQLSPSPDVKHAMTVLATPHGREANPNEALQSGYDAEAGAVLLEAHRALQSMYHGASLTGTNIESFLGSYYSHKEAFGPDLSGTGNSGTSRKDLINTVSLRMHERFEVQARNAAEIPALSQQKFSAWLDGMRLGPETKQAAQTLAAEGGRFDSKTAAEIAEIIARLEDRIPPWVLEKNPDLLVQAKGAQNSFKTAFPDSLPSELAEQAVAAATKTEPNPSSGPKPKIEFKRFALGARRPSTVEDMYATLDNFGYDKAAQEGLAETLYGPQPNPDDFLDSNASQFSEILIIAARNGVIIDKDQAMVIIGAIKENTKRAKDRKGYVPFNEFNIYALTQYSTLRSIPPENRRL